jgi:hypothetical protein
MKTFVKRCAALCAAAAILAIGSSAFADPTGITYTVSTVNSPGTGSGPVVWDNMPSYQYVPGTGTGSALGEGLEVDEMVTPIEPGKELLEWWVRTVNGGGIVPQQQDPTAPSGIFFTDLAWPNMPPGMLVEDTAFIYFTVNGVPQPMADVGSFGLVFFPHPLHDEIQVLALGNDELPATAFGIDTNALAPGLTLGQVLTFVGVGPQLQNVNDVHLGVVVMHIPEPSTMVLGGLGLAALVPLAIRRRLRK